MGFPRKCTICGMTRKSNSDRPCLNKRNKISKADKEKIKENCPAMVMMYV